MTVQLLSTFDPWCSPGSRRRALRAGWGRAWRIAFEFTKNTPLSQPCRYNFPPRGLWKFLAASCPPPRAPSTGPLALLPVPSLSWRSYPLLRRTPFLFPALRFLLKHILRSPDRRTERNRSVVVVFHGHEKITWDSTSTVDSKQAGQRADTALLHAVIAASPGSLLHLWSYFIHFSICSRLRTWAAPPPAPLQPRFLPVTLAFPECHAVNEMWHPHMYLDKIYQWMN